MEFKGTKGRWEINRWGNVFGENEEVAYMPSLTPKKEKEANALLISKAPEMLEMLKACVKTFELLGMEKPKGIVELIKEATKL